MTLQEIMDTCPDWLKACNMLGFSEWAVNEGGGHIQVEITTQQAHQLGIVKLPSWKVENSVSTPVQRLDAYGTIHDIDGQ
jgi:hypothetical protein